jgi:hypothetical protein
MSADGFPTCRHRGGAVAPGLHRCHSPKLAGLKLVTAPLCSGCYCRDHEDATLPAAVVSPRTPPAVMRRLIEAPARHWPAGWADWEATHLAHQQAADAFCAALPPYPSRRFAGRGVVLVGGGVRYLPSLYVTVRALRHAGCRLPIQVWYLGRAHELPGVYRCLLEPYGVEPVDADAVRRRHPCRILNGWELKPYAILHSTFREVLLLDADCYPVRDPSFLFDLPAYRTRGAIFWPDDPVDPRLHWRAFGVAPAPGSSIESGQLVIDKRTCWRPLNLAWWYNDHSDWSYRHGYGDKHTFQVAWAKLGRGYVMFGERGRWAGYAFVHVGPDGAPLFVHRCRDKFRFDNHAYLSRQNTQGNVFRADLPLEAECFGWMAELGRALGRHRGTLNLGCGLRPLAGAHNHDRTRHHDFVDTAWDLDVRPWPWADGAFAEVVAEDVLEHLGDVVGFMDECHRLLRPGGRLRLRVPHWRAENAWLDPTHRRGFHPRSFEFFTGEGLGRQSVYTQRRWRILEQHEERLTGGPNLVVQLTPVAGV